MKKLLVLTTLLLTVLTTACGNKKVKAEVTETCVKAEISETTYEETETEEELEEGWTVEEAKEEVNRVIEELNSRYEELEFYGKPMTIALRNDVIDLCESIEYDETYYYGFDAEKWLLDFVTLLYEHGYCTLEEAILEYHSCVIDLY